MDQRYLVKIGQQIIGEFSFIEVQQQLRTGKITRLHRISSDGGQSWESAHRVAELQVNTAQPQESLATQSTPAGSTSNVEEVAGEGIAGIPQPTEPEPVEEQWYITMSSGDEVGKKYGPFSKAEVELWIKQGRVSADDLVWEQSFADWKPVYMEFETVGTDAEIENDNPGFLKTMFKVNIEKKPKKIIPKEQQSWSIISIAGAFFSFIWLGGLGSLAGIVLSFIGFFEIMSGKGYKRGLIFCFTGLFVGVLGAVLSFIMFFQ